MTRRIWLCLVIVAVIAYLAAPRPAAVIPSEPLGGGIEVDQQRTGAPLSTVGQATTIAASPSLSPAPRATAMTVPVAYGVNPDLTEPPTVRDGIRGQATWWYSFGPGLYAAIRPDLGTKGDLAIVCGGAPWHCLTLPVITTCACLGPGSKRLIDLSRDAFASFADPSAGVVQVVVQIVRNP